ncbi:uncharacterized protein PG986_010668 [Apiospora aurea]|uniref:Uncharacterized protein n=1 Tax=Apiospora aurea TaxID=335848 RepID=A0ABR1Q2Z9_9PEZI
MDPLLATTPKLLLFALQASGQAVDTPPTQSSTAVSRKRNEHRTSWGFSVWRWRRESSSQLNPTSTTAGTTAAPSGTRLHWRPRRLRADADAPRLGHGAQQDQQQRQQQHQQQHQPTAAPLQQGGRHTHSRSLPLLLQPHKSTPTTAVVPSAVAAAAPSAARANGKTRPARNSQFSLPFLSSISPFKSFSRSNQSSPWQPPSSVTPEAGILSAPGVISESDNRDRAAAGNDEAYVQQAPLNSSGRPLGSIAAPTAAADAAPSLPSSSSPAFRGWDKRVHEESDSHLPQLAPPAPISKSQPTWDSSTGTPLLEEEGFDLDPPFAGGHRPVTSPTETLLRRAPASATAERPTHAGPESMAAPMAATFAADPQHPAADPYIQQPPYQQQQQQQSRQSPAPPSRQASFGLPSISRTTSFGWGSKKSSTEDDRRGPSPGGCSDERSPPPPPIDPDTSGEEDAFSPDSRGASPIDNIPQSAPGQQPYYGHISAQAPSSPSKPPASMSHHIARQLAPNSPVANGYGPGPFQHAVNGSDGSVLNASRNSPHMPSGSQHPAMGRGSPSLSQPGQMPRQTTSPLMEGQPFMSSLKPGGVSTGNPVNQLPPSPRWNLQESQLTEPLAPRKTHSPQPRYDPSLDKETGVRSHVSSAPSQPPQRMRNSGLPPVAAQKYPGLFPAGASNHPPIQFAQAPRQDQIQATSGPRQDAIAFSKPIANEFQPGDDNDLRRSPSLSKEIGGKFNGRGSTDGAVGSIRSDDVSENSDVVGFDPSEQARRVSMQSPQNPPAMNGNQPHSQPMQHFRSVSEHVGGPDGGPHEEKKKKPFFGGVKKPQSSFSVVNSDPFSTKNDPQPGKAHGRGGARKRLSELKDIFKNNGHDEDQLANPGAPQAQAQAQAQAGRPSMSDPLDLKRAHRCLCGINNQVALVSRAPVLGEDRLRKSLHANQLEECSMVLCSRQTTWMRA